MSKYSVSTITGLFFIFFSSIITADDHVDDERMDEHHPSEKVIKMERLPAQIRLNAEACKGMSPTDRVMDQTDGSMVACAEARSELKKLEKILLKKRNK